MSSAIEITMLAVIALNAAGCVFWPWVFKRRYDRKYERLKVAVDQAVRADHARRRAEVEAYAAEVRAFLSDPIGRALEYEHAEEQVH